MVHKRSALLPVILLALGGLAILLVINLTASSAPEKDDDSGGLVYPAARRMNQTDVYHGVTVADPYRWLEQDDAPEARKWLKAQDALATNFSREVPGYETLKERMTQIRIFDRYSRPVKENGRIFFNITPAGKSRAALYFQQSETAEPELLIDPETHFSDPQMRLRTFVPSPDGKRVAYEIGQGQSNWRTLRVFDVESRRDLEDEIEGLHRWGGWVNWLQDGSGFFYRQFDKSDSDGEARAGITNARIRYHNLGEDPANDQTIYTRDDKDNWLFAANLTLDGHYLVISAFEGGGVENLVLYKDLRNPSVEARELIGKADAAYTFIGSRGNQFWFVTDLQAPNRRIISVDLEKPSRENWRELVSESGETLQSATAVGEHFIARYVKDAKPALKLFGQNGNFVRNIELPDIGGVGGVSGRQIAGSEFYYSFNSLYDPSTIYKLDLNSGVSEILYRPNLAFDPDDFTTRQVFYKSKDGTRVPMFISHLKSLKLSGNDPLFMYGYGAWGWSAFPWFQPHILAWMEMGGIYALPGIRGGGEYGEAWHQAGIKLNKQNGIDDFIAAGEWLVENGYTSRERLVANGGSASGVLAGAAVVQRPDLFGAAVIDIPSLDLIRFVESPAGKYLTPEYGSPADPAEFKVLRWISPYHNLKAGQCYPPTMVMVGERDETAIPMHGYKFMAQMQQVQGCDHPALLKVMWGAGHNYGITPEQSAESWADAWGFLIKTLNLESAKTRLSKL